MEAVQYYYCRSESDERVCSFSGSFLRSSDSCWACRLRFPPGSGQQPFTADHYSFLLVDAHHVIVTKGVGPAFTVPPWFPFRPIPLRSAQICRRVMLKQTKSMKSIQDSFRISLALQSFLQLQIFLTMKSFNPNSLPSPFKFAYFLDFISIRLFLAFRCSMVGFSTSRETLDSSKIRITYDEGPTYPKVYGIKSSEYYSIC